MFVFYVLKVLSSIDGVFVCFPRVLKQIQVVL